jgi:hypothetical protein
LVTFLGATAAGIQGANGAQRRGFAPWPSAVGTRSCGRKPVANGLRPVVAHLTGPLGPAVEPSS